MSKRLTYFWIFAFLVALATAVGLKPMIEKKFALDEVSEFEYADVLQKEHAGPFKVSETNIVNPKELECLALNIYYESRGEPELGQWAVGRVTQERLKAGFARSICGVVYQGARYRDRTLVHLNSYGSCQFSWACTRETPKVPDPAIFQQAKEIAYQLLAHDAYDQWLKDVHYFHAGYVSPSWQHRFVRVKKIGAHIFYRDTRRANGV